METMITFKDVSFRYDRHAVFENLNFTIAKGEFIGIVGSNGSGKSTFLKLLLKENKPLQGEVQYMNDFSIGYVEQIGLSSDSTFPASVYEIVLLGLYKEISFFHRVKKEHQQKVRKALEIVGIVDLANKQISSLSGGQQQRVMIAKAIVSNPNLLVFDEATSGIDAKTTNELIQMLTKLNHEQKTTIIMVSHHFDDAKYISRMIEIDNGAIYDRKRGV